MGEAMQCNMPMCTATGTSEAWVWIGLCAVLAWVIVSILWGVYILGFAVVARQQEMSSFKIVRSLGPMIFSTCWVMQSYYHMLSLLPFIFFYNKEEARRIVHLRGYYVSKFTMDFMGWDVQVEGSIPKTPVVFVANHQSMADVALMHIALPGGLFSWISKSSVFWAPGIGWFMSAAGYVPLKRHHKGSVLHMFKLAKKALHDGWSIVMFPAGTRKRHKLVPFKTGAFLLAAEKGVPVVPVSLQLPEDLWAARRGTRCQLRVVFHQPIMVKLDPDTEGAPVDTQQESHADKANETPKQGEEQGLSVEEASTEAFKKIVAGLGPGYYES